MGLSLFRRRRRLFKFAEGRKIGGFFFSFSFFMLHRPYYTERTQNVQKRSKTVSEPGTFQFQIETFFNVFKCWSRFPDTFENVQKPRTSTPAIYRKTSGNLEPFKNFRKTSDFREQNPFQRNGFWILADLDGCFFHFRGVDSRFVDLVPRTYNTFFLVLKCAGNNQVVNNILSTSVK